ncbi:934_t:CDS:2, partial [Funneliformis mosseae]
MQSVTPTSTNHRQSRGGFSASFKTEAFILRRSLDYQLEKGSDEAKVYAKRLLDVFNKHHNFENVEAFWKTIEAQKSEKEQLEDSKIQALRSVFEGATMYTNQVFQTAAENLISANIVNERKRPAEEGHPILMRPPNLRDRDECEEAHHIDRMEGQKE